jgi:DNA-binding CsgD family transcriptional regulator
MADRGDMSELEHLSAVIGQIYDAALDPSLWPAVLESVCGFVGGYTGNIFIQDSQRTNTQFLATWGLDPTYWRAYLDKYGKLNPAMPTMLLLDAGRVISSNDVVPDARLHATRFYKEWLQPHGFVDCVGTVLEKSWLSAAAFVIFRNDDHGSVDATARRKMGLLVPHIQRATLIGKTIDLKSVATANFANTLDALSTAIFLLSASGTLLHANLAGVNLRARGDIFSSSDAGLRICDPALDIQFQAMLAAASSGATMAGGQNGALSLAGRGGERHVARTLPLASAGSRRARSFHGAALAVFVSPAALQRPTLVESVVARFRLTPAEVRVLFAIIEIGGVPEIAPVLGVSEGTVKSHLKRLFAKTGTNRQVELVRTIAEFSNSLVF